MKTINIKEVCKTCNGTGLYIGMGERDGSAIVCHICKGTGCHDYKHTYEEFTTRIDCANVKRVYKSNPGICIGEGDNCKLEDFGGISFDEWKNGVEFTQGTEDRKHTCPAWWYQGADHTKKPNWKECSGNLGRAFSSCNNFDVKLRCWEKFDLTENKS